MKKLFKIAAAAFSLVIFPMIAHAAPPNPQQKAALIRSLDAVLPVWGAEVLRAPAGVDWTGNLNVAGVARSFNLSEVVELAAGAPAGTEGVKGKTGFVRVDKARGFVRMVNNLLVPRIGATPIPLPNDDQTNAIGLKALGQLGIPSGEIGPSNAATQMAADGSVASARPDRVSAILRLYSVDRNINKLPVFGSNAVIAITGRGEVQRLKVQWPMFKLDVPGGLLTRAEVLDRAGDTMVDQYLRATAVLKAEIGYAPADNTVGSPYIPVAMISAADGQTPLLFSVPLTKPSAADDR
ncbi:MAG: hypothetical protein HC855_00845 [Rhizobiales bacterium]|nr:hypothetical protein [Hyphomicrobiales bacterium]